MMQDVLAQVVEQIGAGAASVDGKYLLLKVTMDGRERIFAFQQHHVIGLINIMCGVRRLAVVATGEKRDAAA